MIAWRADRPTAVTPGVDKACHAEDFVNELHSKDVTPNVHGTSAVVALRLTGERPGAVLSARASQADRAGIRLGQDSREARKDQAVD